MIYLDTSIVISLLTRDACTSVAEAWWREQTVPLGISPWTAAEFYALIGRRCRGGEETTRNTTRIINTFDAMITDNLSMLKCSETAILRAASWLRFPECTLQMADALHLAIAVENEVAAIATFDKHFAQAIERQRIAGLKVIALAPATGSHEVHQDRAQYNVTERDVTKAVKFARKRKAEERMKAGSLRVRGQG